MSDIQRNGNDFRIVNGDLAVIENSDSVKQEVIERLQSFSHEWFLDEEGLPYFDELTGKNVNVGHIKSIILDTITNTNGVYSVEEFELLYDTESRTTIANIIIRTVYNENRSISLRDFGRLEMIPESVILDGAGFAIRDSTGDPLEDSSAVSNSVPASA